MMNPDLARLQPYPFERLAALKADITAPAHRSPINLSIGEPRHPTPLLIGEALTAHLGDLAVYPTTRGGLALRRAIADWLTVRFALPVNSLDPEAHVLPVNGTREALFAFAQAVIDRTVTADPQQRPLVFMPNPFYQIYEGAALLAGAEPRFLPCTAASAFLPDFSGISDDEWARCQLLYLCSPGNPTGAVLDLPTLQHLIALADQHDFIIAADECYSEIYPDEAHPPPGLLQAAAALGRSDYHRCVVFHSLSKRSNCPGLRSGFVAGDAEVLQRFFLYRTYHGSAMSLPVQATSCAAWRDETHVRENRVLYREKFAAVLDILCPVLPVNLPAASFYSWIETPLTDIHFTRELFARENVTVLPGSFLSRTVAGNNPGQNRVRVAWVASQEACVEAAWRIRRCVESL